MNPDVTGGPAVDAPANSAATVPAAVSAQLAAEQAAFVNAVAEKLNSFLDSKSAMLAAISNDTLVLLESIRTLVTGGKRLRALMCYWGWRGAGGQAGAEQIVTAGAALELFQAAALIHDDIIDRSDTRRGGPSVHKQFSQLHAGSGWALDEERFGHAAAILTGDLCLSFSEEAFAAIGPRSAAGTTARDVFNIMRAEVMAGQYLDILEEVSGPSKPVAGAVDRATSIIRYKSAKYSAEHPLVMGGALAAGSAELLAGYSAFALPLGEAFQLRDDVLGVFGDPATTGKPAGDDLREGKRTVLVGLTLTKTDDDAANFVHGNLGNQELTEEMIGEIRAIMVRCGALDETESMISALSGEAFAALAKLPIPDDVKAALGDLGTSAVRRKA